MNSACNLLARTSFLDIKYINLSNSGASADEITRTTLKYFLEIQFKNTFNPKDYFVIISWPGLFRTEIYKDEKFVSLVTNNDEQYKKQLDSLSYTYYKAWAAFAKPFPQTISYYHNILLTQFFLTANKIKYLFWNASSTFPHCL